MQQQRLADGGDGWPTEEEIREEAEAQAANERQQAEPPQRQTQQRPNSQATARPRQAEPKQNDQAVAVIEAVPELEPHLTALPQNVAMALFGRADLYKPTLPPDIQPGQFMEGTMRAMRKLHAKGDLVKANVASIRDALMEAISLGHLPGRDCHLVVLKGRMERWDDYRGLQRSLMRCPVVRDSYAEVVKHGDHFEHDLLTGEMSHKLRLGSARSTQPPLGYYAVIVFRDGYRRMKLMTIDEIQHHKKTIPSARKQESAWTTHFEQMAKKTVLLALCRSVQQVQGAYHDEDAARYADFDPDSPFDPTYEPVGAEAAKANLYG